MAGGQHQFHFLLGEGDDILRLRVRRFNFADDMGLDKTFFESPCPQGRQTGVIIEGRLLRDTFQQGYTSLNKREGRLDPF